MKTASQVLREAKALIGTPEKWLRGDDASDGNGRVCIGCSMGFYDLAVNYFDLVLADYVPSAQPGKKWSRPIYQFNADPKTAHADVMAAFDRAIALAEKDEAPARKPREEDSAWASRMVAEVTAHGTRVDAMTGAEQVEKA